MKRIRVESIEQLREAIALFPPGAIFRGQATHYGKNDGSPVIGTSFDRKGCIPPEMIKWSNYARSILKPILRTPDISLEFTHAILQHYGWTSWYVDCTMNPAVAAWFASHEYNEDRSSGIFEDYQERPVWLEYRFSHYDYLDGEAHFYVLDSNLAARDSGLTDLSAITIPGARSRAEAQSAWLIGPLANRNVPENVFWAHVSGPRAVFRDFAEENGLFSTHDLFPSVDEDPILDVLLSLPWKQIGDLGNKSSSLPICRRSLSLPEYQHLKFKIAPPSVAFYNGTSIGNPSSGKGIVVPVGQDVLYGSPEPGDPPCFPKVTALVRQHGSVAFECAELLRHPHLISRSTYQKGVAVVEEPNGVIALGELVVEHPGLDLISSGISRPWFYRADPNGTWTKESHPEECDCGDDSCHLRHLESLKIVEWMLSKRAITRRTVLEPNDISG